MFSLPLTLIPLICHYLPLRQLLVWSTVNRHVRSIVCCDLPPSTVCPSSSAGNCWRFVSNVRLGWGVVITELDNDIPQASLKLDGAVLHGVTADIRAALTDDRVSQQPQPTIAEAFASVSLSPPLYDSSVLDYLHPTPPPPSPPHVPFPLIPPLAALLRSLRFVRRLEWKKSLDAAGLRVLLTVLSVLPSFPLLHHLALKCGGEPWERQQRALRDDERDCVVNGVFGCLVSLPRLSSLELDGQLPTERRHSAKRTQWVETQFACDVLSTLLGERLLHASMPACFLSDWLEQQAQTADARLSLATIGMHSTGMNHISHGAALHYGARRPRYTALRSLRLTGDGVSVRRLVHVFPSLVLLDTRLDPSAIEVEARPVLSPAARGDERLEAADGGEQDASSGSSSSSGRSSGWCALRFLKTCIDGKGMPEMRILAQLHFLHSLHIHVTLPSTGPEPLTSLATLANLTQLRELTLKVDGGTLHRGIWQLQPEEVFDLMWLDHLAHLRYLHIQAFSHTSLDTLRSLGLLPHSPHPSRRQSPSTLPLFVSRVEEFGLDVYEGCVSTDQVGDFTFDAWKRLRRCAVCYVTVSYIVGGAGRYNECEAANAILREKIGEARWVSEEELVSGRWDARWKKEVAACL